MQTVLSNPWFHIVVVPIAFVLVGASASSLGRRDGDTSPQRNNWAVGTTLLLMTIGTIAADLHTYSKDQKIVNTLTGWLIGLMFVTFMSINHDRYTSWQRDGQGSRTDGKHIFWGVILPNTIAAGLYGLYRYSLGVQP